MEPNLHAVTGAFGYSGKYIARRLLAAGTPLITLTNSKDRGNEFGGAVKAYPFNFEEPEALIRSLENVSVLYNTYWVRFNHRLFKHADAVKNTLILFEAARKAGVQKIVHISITNPALASPLEYFRGKAELEAALIESGTAYTILRPAVIFGKEDILINNIAWVLRHLPVFGVFGDGQYRLQPIYADDLAELAVRAGQSNENSIVNAIGPETFTYTGLVQMVARLIGSQRPLVSVPPELGFQVARLLGYFVDDVIITRAEIEGLMADLLYVDAAPTGSTRLTDWVSKQAPQIGRQYTSELARRKDRLSPYASN